MRNCRGVSLIELLIAVVIVVLVTLGVSHMMQKSMRVAHQNRQRMQANSVAQGVVQRILAQPYAYIDPTPMSEFKSAGQGMTDTACNCSDAAHENFASWPANATTAHPYNETVTASGVAFVVKVCINRAAKNTTSSTPAWYTYCPDHPASDTTLKFIKVQVSWMDGSMPRTFDYETFATR